MWFAALIATACLGGGPLVPYVADVTAAFWQTVTNHVPQTQLLLDEQNNTWLWQNLYAPQGEIDYWSAFLFVDADLELRPWLDLTVLLNTGEVRTGASLMPPLDDAVTANGQTVANAAEELTFIRELSLTAHSGGWMLQAGKQRVTMAQGLLYDDFAVGAVLHWKAAEKAPLPLTARIAALWLGQSPQLPTPESPLIYARGASAWSPLESVGLFAAFYSDTAGSLGDVLEAAVAERIVQEAPDADKQTRLTDLLDQAKSSHGSIFYAGADWDIVPATGWRVRGAALLERGRLTFSPGPNTTLALDLTGWATHTWVSREMAPWLTLSMWGFALSGDEPPAADAVEMSYNGYIGVAPFYTWSNLFFTGGLNQGFFAGRATAACVNGHGAAGGGIASAWSMDDLRADVRALYLTAFAEAPAFAGGGLGYGLEIDVVVHWTVLAWLTVALEFDTLLPGNFFPAGSPPAVRAIGQLYVTWGT